ncbi:MAG: AMP-binding protein, partial [Aestuariivirga sp.]
MTGVLWPKITGKGLECLVSLGRSLEQTQFLGSSEIQDHQREQLEILLVHAARHSAYFSNRLAAAGVQVKQLLHDETWSAFAVLSRRDLQANEDSMKCAEVPLRHQPFNFGITSGSTGEPVKVMRTGLNRLIWMAMTMREHQWNKRDFGLRSTSVRAGIPSLAIHDDWGPPVSLLHKSGRSQGIPITSSAAQQADWIKEFGPSYLLHYPNSLAALVDHCEHHSIELPSLRQIRSIGETLSPALRARVKAVLNVGITDTYSSNEIGVIAVECPVSGKYHVMAENLIVEILNKGGKPCVPGEVGRVVLTDLHNFATPIFRYDIGDYAEQGDGCLCGRGLPTLNRIMGRERNLVMKPDGTRNWPLV